ncbi:hypothetical protein H6P81_021637 [Aristolochia fimbriata]|uniref:Uncharacterized protein n=1 Tax=Aristolochia fimbriata TaxID=158543 RepID=A0AAV7DR00_ARIFI|nr:hypothetical protein H6P81_021637 [Aristolochia fimbriata]
MGTFFPYHYITYGNRHALVNISAKMDSIMKSMAKELSSHIITLPMETNCALVRISKIDSIMKSMAIVDFFIENKGTFFPYHYITYGKRESFGQELSSHIITLPMEAETALVIICENGSIMKSMAMVDFFIENKGQALVVYLRKWVDNEIHGYNSTSSLKIKELSSHIITLPMETEPLLVRISRENGFDNEIHGYESTSSLKIKTLLVRYLENGSIMKSMAMFDFFIENKRNFLPISLHYLWKQNALVIICENGSIMKSMAMELSSNIITLPMERTALWSYICENGSIMKSMAIWSTSSLKIKELSSHIITLPMESRTSFGQELSSHIITLPMETDKALVVYAKMNSIMKSMAMMDFFIENKGTFFPYHYITYGSRPALVRNFLPISLHYLWKQTAFGTFFPYHYITYGKRTAFLVIICENGSIMKSMAMVDFFIENKGTFFPYHYITYGKQDSFGRICENELDNEIHGYEWTSSLKIKGTFFPYHYITYGSRTRFWSIICENGSIMKSMAMSRLLH